MDKLHTPSNPPYAKPKVLETKEDCENCKMINETKKHFVQLSIEC